MEADSFALALVTFSDGSTVALTASEWAAVDHNKVIDVRLVGYGREETRS